MAAFQAVSHCYKRPTYPDWPYSIFTMVHARSMEACEEAIDAIAEDIGRHRPLAPRRPLLHLRVQEDPARVLHAGLHASGRTTALAGDPCRR